MLSRKMALGLLAGCSVMAAWSAPDIVPTPKIYRSGGRTVAVDQMPLWIEPGNRQCEIGAEELAGRIRELGGAPGTVSPLADRGAPGILILTVASPHAQGLNEKYSLEVSAANPGEQGYALHAAEKQIVIIGCDNTGALYGAMTLRQMLAAGPDGAVRVEQTRIRDWPDFKFRSSIILHRGLGQLAYREKDTLAAYQAGIDILLRFKLNVFFDYRMRSLFLELPEDTQKLVADLNRYAAERGVYHAQYVNSGIELQKTNTDWQAEFDAWPCVKTSAARRATLACWSEEPRHLDKITRTADLCRTLGIKLLLIHPVDGGAIEDPEMWSQRCPECRKRWRDGERYKATIHQLNTWAAIFRARAPDTILQCPMYPYNAVYSVRARFPQVSDAVWRQNSVDYWEQVNAGADPDILTGSWVARREHMNAYRTCYRGRGAAVCDPYPYDSGVFATYYRHIISVFYGHPRDIFWSRGTQVNGNWLTLINCGEFAWNTLAPGNEEYKLLFYDMEQDHTQPAAIMEEWLPRACRLFWGQPVGDAIAPLFQSGILPFYIVDPGNALARSNKARRAPLAEMDPENAAAADSESDRIAPDMLDSPERMAAQVAAAEKSLAAVQAAYRHYDTLNRYLKKEFMYYYRRVPALLAVARARQAILAGTQLLEENLRPEAAALLQAALAAFDRDAALYASTLAAVKGQGDILPPDKLKFGAIPDLREIRKSLRSRLADASLVLKPRQPGKLIRVGLFDGSGAQGARDYFARYKNVRAEIITALNLATLDQFDVVFIFKSNRINRTDFFSNVRRYVVEGGGGIIIEHDLVGGKRNIFGQTTPFPEICRQGAERIDGREVTIATNHPALHGLQQGAIAEIMYVDWINPVPGANAQVLAVDQAGRPVAVAGGIGLGKVIFNGSVSVASVGGTYDAVAKPLYGFNAALAAGAVEWMTGRKLTAE